MHWLFYIMMQVLLDTTALEQEKRQLEMENEKLRLLLKQYLDGNVARAVVLSMANFAFSWSRLHGFASVIFFVNRHFCQ